MDKSVDKSFRQDFSFFPNNSRITYPDKTGKQRLGKIKLPLLNIQRKKLSNKCMTIQVTQPNRSGFIA